MRTKNETACIGAEEFLRMANTQAFERRPIDSSIVYGRQGLGIPNNAPRQDFNYWAMQAKLRQQAKVDVESGPGIRALEFRDLKESEPLTWLDEDLLCKDEDEP